MTALSSHTRRVVLRILSGLLYYTGFLRGFNVAVNGFQRGESTAKHRRSSVPEKRGRNLQILTYHRVRDREDAYLPSMEVGVFERQMRYLSTNFNVLPLEDAVSMMIGEDLVENAVAITFDDGYRDVFVNAFPILKRFRLPATVFLATGAMGNGSLLWHDRVFAAFMVAKASTLKDPAGSGKAYALVKPRERLSALHDTLDWLRSLPEAERDEAILALTMDLGAQGINVRHDVMLRWEDVRFMRQHGVDFGAHTVTHPILSGLTQERAREEIRGSKEAIEGQIDAPVRTFAYPNGKRGDFNQSTIDILKDCGFSCAVTTVFGTNRAGGDPFQLKRESPWEPSLPLFALKRNWNKLTA